MHGQGKVLLLLLLFCFVFKIESADGNDPVEQIEFADAREQVIIVGLALPSMK